MDLEIIALILYLLFLAVIIFLGLRRYYKMYEEFIDTCNSIRQNIIDIDSQIEALKNKL